MKKASRLPQLLVSSALSPAIEERMSAFMTAGSSATRNCSILRSTLNVSKAEDSTAGS